MIDGQGLASVDCPAAEQQSAHEDGEQDLAGEVSHHWNERQHKAQHEQDHRDQQQRRHQRQRDAPEHEPARGAVDRRLEALTLTTEANAKAIEANTKAIADLTSSVTGLREEMRLGFSGIQGQITNLDTKLSGQITWS